MGSYGLLGRHLGHSFSPQIHALLGDYDYGLYPVEPEALRGLFRAVFTPDNATLCALGSPRRVRPEVLRAILLKLG